MASKSIISLFPWDAKCATHRAWLYKQRVECNWDYEKVEKEWREEQIKGTKCMYWIVRCSDDSDIKPVSKENEEVLYDTADSVNGRSRVASREAFAPIGHISLDSKNKDADRVGLDIPLEGVFWIKSFFILQTIQGQGIGRAAMDAVENMATREPLCAQTLMLDTVTSKHQQREDFAISTYGAVPKITNQDWYGRRGYMPIKIVPNYYDVWDANGDRWDIEIVFMRKDIQ
ncbi:uncharacterized protein N7484_008292 [Penicillium longicatenatum]|uniref:uncharacterized protein n=1 Tax=Penicillium longicatenatum TaxID=1561947 RepID=UPI002546EB34|nr:uncharacterized protein N7484_008292 [Penicillium longicatenatum]KAJ5634979.1 hypothetical protein N7484_008292 [Penicillium longicatenatum]KAJ5655165.1 hypothetical protein N7507_007115 [Penicillium longicatenatum]